MLVMDKKCDISYRPSLPACNSVYYHRSFCDFIIDWHLFDYKSNSHIPSNYYTQDSFTFVIIKLEIINQYQFSGLFSLMLNA